MQPSEDNMPGEMVPLHGGKSAESTDLGVADVHATSAFTARRDQIEHEDNLIGMRINWLVAAETFLFVVYAILVNGESFSHRLSGGKINPVYSPDARHLFDLIPWLGIALVLCVVVSVTAAIYAIAKLQSRAPRPPKDFPPLASSRLTHITGFFSAAGVPVVLLGAWSFILATR